MPPFIPLAPIFSDSERLLSIHTDSALYFGTILSLLGIGIVLVTLSTINQYTKSERQLLRAGYFVLGIGITFFIFGFYALVTWITVLAVAVFIGLVVGFKPAFFDKTPQ